MQHSSCTMLAYPFKRSTELVLEAVLAAIKTSQTVLYILAWKYKWAATNTPKLCDHQAINTTQLCTGNKRASVKNLNMYNI